MWVDLKSSYIVLLNLGGRSDSSQRNTGKKRAMGRDFSEPPEEPQKRKRHASVDASPPAVQPKYAYHTTGRTYGQLPEVEIVGISLSTPYPPLRKESRLQHQQPATSPQLPITRASPRSPTVSNWVSSHTEAQRRKPPFDKSIEVIEIFDSSDEGSTVDNLVVVRRRGSGDSGSGSTQPFRMTREDKDKGKGRADKPHSPQARSTTYDGDPWTYNFSDLDTAQLEALAIVASAEAGLAIEEFAGEAGGDEKELGGTASPNSGRFTGGQDPFTGNSGELGSTRSTHLQGGQERPAGVSSSDRESQQGELCFDDDGDAIMTDDPSIARRTPPLSELEAVTAILGVQPGLDVAYVRKLVKMHAPGHGNLTADFVLEEIFSSINPHAHTDHFQEAEASVAFHANGERGVPKQETPPNVECQCCFEQHPPRNATQCRNGHPFCISCLRRYAELRLVAQDPDLRCMQQGDCGALFEIDQLRRALPDSLFSLFERVQRRQELKKAQLTSFEECPFCDWGCIMEVSIADSPTFRCRNDAGCGKVSCRRCRKEEHTPAPCDANKGSRLAIEEAMTLAVIRTCPNCPQGEYPPSKPPLSY